MANVAVLPVPDCACAMTSRLLMICEIARCWIADGFSNPESARAESARVRARAVTAADQHAKAKVIGACHTAPPHTRRAPFAPLPRPARAPTVGVDAAQKLVLEAHLVERVDDLDIGARLEHELLVLVKVDAASSTARHGSHCARAAEARAACAKGEKKSRGKK